MLTTIDRELTSDNKRLWIISEGRPSDLDLSEGEEALLKQRTAETEKLLADLEAAQAEAERLAAEEAALAAEAQKLKATAGSSQVEGTDAD